MLINNVIMPQTAKNVTHLINFDKKLSNFFLPGCDNVSTYCGFVANFSRSFLLPPAVVPGNHSPVMISM